MAGLSEEQYQDEKYYMFAQRVGLFNQKVKSNLLEVDVKSVCITDEGTLFLKAKKVVKYYPRICMQALLRQ